MPQTQSGIEASAYLYFIVSTVIMVLCIVCYNLVGKLPVLQYYEKLKKSPLESIYLLGPGGLSDQVDNQPKAQVLTGSETMENVYDTLNAKKSVSYVHVWKKVKWLALALAFIYVVTISIYPGHITEDLHSSYFGDWYAVILTLAYNLFDFIGKFLPGSSKFMIQILMIIGPKSVPIEEAEVTGILMVMFLILGLASGSILEWVWVL
ncbi:hypothetical protein GOP47_0001964 [Adiantum capillus-veneris]|uniref:Uncharacterized protein n=1 Tax=Adiantum capillus-veneris TaxID=13818 RepID=A0A9D4VAL3_ADICA|nr:hypothetical protein GOP47_0001964 [Adiantum capillus-veneris]